jgi:hypothetical protein
MKTTRETNLDLPKECDYIVAKAVAGENAIVMMGPLMFLAYAKGDAFVLDIEDKFACQLCDDGKKQRYPLFDSGTQWVSNGRGGISWQKRTSTLRESTTRTQAICLG